MTTEWEKLGGMSWHLRSFVFQTAFEQLATSLRWMFWGLLLQLFGAAIVGAPLATALLQRARPKGATILPGMILLLVGGIVLLIGEQKCLDLKSPLGMTRSLPGHGWLRGAYWCHLGSWLLRIGRQWIGRGPVALALLPLQVAGFMLLLLFLRRTADVLSRGDLKRLVDLIFIMGSVMLFLGAIIPLDMTLHLGILKGVGAAGFLTLMAVLIVMGLTITGTYVILLGRMASAASAFAKYLGAIEAPEVADDMGDDMDDAAEVEPDGL